MEHAQYVRPKDLIYGGQRTRAEWRTDSRSYGHGSIGGCKSIQGLCGWVSFMRGKSLRSLSFFRSVTMSLTTGSEKAHVHIMVRKVTYHLWQICSCLQLSPGNRKQGDTKLLNHLIFASEMTVFQGESCFTKGQSLFTYSNVIYFRVMHFNMLNWLTRSVLRNESEESVTTMYQQTRIEHDEETLC